MFASIVTGFFAEDDIKLNNQTFNWPGRMDPIFEVGQQRLTSRREKATKPAAAVQERPQADRETRAGQGRDVGTAYDGDREGRDGFA